MTLMQTPIEPSVAVPRLTGKSLARVEVGIEALLWWAFQREYAQLDFSRIGQLGGVALPAWGTEYVMIERAKLGCKPDGGGRSEPHPDADLIADALVALPVACGGQPMAVAIAEYSRSGMRPDPMVGCATKVVPIGWHANRHGNHAKTEVCGQDVYTSRGRSRVVDRRCCPITYSPSSAKIASKRREYLHWWSALLELRNTFQIHGNLTSFVVTDAMPPMEPWKKVLTKS